MRALAAPFATALAVSLLAGAPQARATEAPPPPPTGLARFTDHQRFYGAKISPKGTYLAAAVAQGGRRALVFIDLKTRKPVGAFNPLTATNTAVGRFEWASDERVVVELVESDGTLAAPVSNGEIYAVNAVTGAGALIFGYRTGNGGTGTHIRQAEQESVFGSILDTLRGDDRYILVSGGSFQDVGDRQLQVWKVDTITGIKDRVAMGPMPNCTFVTDAAGVLRLAFARDEKAKEHFFLREKDGWKELTRIAGLPAGSVPWGFVAADQALLVEAPQPGGSGVFQVPLDGGEARLLAKTKLVPVDRWITDDATGRVVAIRSQPDLPTWEVVAPAHPLGKAFAALLDEYAGWEVELTSWSEDQRLAVVKLSGDKAPAQYHLLEVATGKLEPLVSARPWIDPKEMGEVEAFHITASDGFKIHGYLTLPPSAPAGPPPLVLLIHGGPHGVRDSWDFNWEAQLLASRGFAVLQVNYRGSGGYGRAFEEAGYRHWGDRVIDDVLDAARWAIRKQKVDGGRVCAMGGSFGAYASMQAAIRAPDLVRCAVGIAGIYDLTRMDWTGDISWSRNGRGYIHTVLGEDQDNLKAFSPARNADKLKVPVLLAHGGRDERAPIAHAEKLRDALTDLGRPPEWIVERTEGHGFFDEAARLRLYQKVVAFLERNTAPRPVAPATPVSPPAGSGPVSTGITGDHGTGR